MGKQRHETLPPRQVGKLCYSCGLCYIHGAHRYEIYESLLEGWNYKGATFLVCGSCGTAHAVEHAGKAGVPERLRARRGPLFLPISPRMRRGYKERIKERIVELKRQGEILAQWNAQSPECYPPFNLLPLSPWNEAREHVRSFYTLVGCVCSIFFGLLYCIPVLFYQTMQDTRWDRNHPPEDWQKRRHIEVTSPETLEQQEQRLLALHQNFEALWPVVLEGLPTRDLSDDSDPSAEANLYTDLNCSHCGAQGSLLRDLPAPENPPYPRGPMLECPCCKRSAVLWDVYGKTDTSLYLLGNILIYDSYPQSEWIRRFSSRQAPRSETAVVRVENREREPRRITNSEPEDAPQLWVPPGQCYDVYLKVIEDEARIFSDSGIAHFLLWEVVAVRGNGCLIYEAGEVER